MTAPELSIPTRSINWHALRRQPLLVASLLVIVFVTVWVFAATITAPYPPLEQDLLNAYSPPSTDHLFGTDGLGRDIYSRMLWGGQPALSGVAVAIAVYGVLGLILGVLGGFLRGWVDRAIVGLLDVMLSVPALIIILAVLAIFNQDSVAAMVVLGLFGSANLARIVRSSCIALREELFVDAARVSGLSSGYIMVRHIFPALLGLMFIQMALFAGIALAVQTGLGFLGLATPPPAPSWGGMVGESAQVIERYPWFLYITGGVIAVMAIAFGLLGDGLRDLTAESRTRAGASKPAYVGGPTPPSSGARPALLSVRNYSIAFSTTDGVQPVVDDVSFDVQAGEIFGLVGESGSGKTVTALSLLGLLPSNGAVVSGTATLNGEQISPASDAVVHRIRGRGIGLVSQEPMVALDPNYTIGAQLREIIRKLSDESGLAVEQRALALLASVRLPDPAAVLRRYPHELSGGMIQRVVIAMALAGSPQLLLADEPTTALDVTVQAGILDLLRSLRDERGMAVILVTHDLGVVADVCDRAIVMQKGRIVEQGSVDQIFYAPTDEYTRTLLSSTPNILKGTDE